MTLIRNSGASIGLGLTGVGSGKPIGTNNPNLAQTWVRPTQWVSFTTPTSSEQKIIGNVAVYDALNNYVALTMTTTDGSQYNVDWGDGTSGNFNSGVAAEKNYTYSSLSSGTTTDIGYRQATITITPTTAGKTFSIVNLGVRHSAYLSASSTISNPWLDIAISAPNATEIIVSAPTSGAAGKNASISICQQVNIVSHNMTNMSSLFLDCTSLQSVLIANAGSVTNMSAMFQRCYALQKAPEMDTSSVTNMSKMFQDCFYLTEVPLYNTANVTDMSSMFVQCIALKTVPLFNTVKVTTFNATFSYCDSLETVPLFDTGAVTDMFTMFLSCKGLKTVPLFNTANVTNMGSMFSTCDILQTVPLFNTVKVTDMSGMFSGCKSLFKVPLFNTAEVTSMGSMFNNCKSLKEIPLFNTVKVTSMASMFANCDSLKSVPSFDTGAVTSMQSMFSGCDVLESVPSFNTANVTNMQSMFSGCKSLQLLPAFDTGKVINMSSMLQECISLAIIPAWDLFDITTVTNNNLAAGNGINTIAAVMLQKISITGNRFTQSLQNCRMSATELDAFYTACQTLNPSVTNVTASGGVVTYTVNDIRAFLGVTGRTVTMTGINPAAYNLTNVTVTGSAVTTGNAGTFTVTNAATGTYVSGGTATIQNNKTITVTNNPGAASDTPTIATNKGWQVTG